MKESIFIAILIVLIYVFFIKNQLELMSVNINGEKVLVRKTKDYKKSASLLYELINRMYILRDHLVNNLNSFTNEEMIRSVRMLGENFKKDRTLIYETALNSEYTSYNVNKGEEIVFCLRDKRTLELHDINLLVYVAVHELGHSGCWENGHPPLFDRIFYFYLSEAIKLGIYNYEDYNTNPVMYCGMNLNTNIMNYF
jgi:predicted metal-dependent hydrolase